MRMQCTDIVQVCCALGTFQTNKKVKNHEGISLYVIYCSYASVSELVNQFGKFREKVFKIQSAS